MSTRTKAASKAAPKQPEMEILEFPEAIKNKCIALLNQAQAIQNQLISTIDTYMDAKEMTDKDTWQFDNRNVRLVREKQTKK